jgi:hypothetical protein
MSKGKILTLVAVCALVLASAVTPAAARWWRGGHFYRAYGYGYRFAGNSLRPPAGQIWVRGFRNAPTRQARLRQDFQLDGAYR